MREAVAQAQPNIALLKYWGKQDSERNLPAVPSLSITLASLWTRTRVRFDPMLSEDRLLLDGRRNEAQRRRVAALLEPLRRRAGVSLYADISSHNNFPTASGLASSASGFAALVTAASHALGLRLSPGELSAWARRGSASAARSMFGGFVELPGAGHPGAPELRARPVLPPEAWPLEVVVVITTRGTKGVGSSDGMVHTARTSPFYAAWVDDAAHRLMAAHRAIQARDFECLAELSEASCLTMHGLSMSARPGLLYWNGVTVELMHCVRALRAAGTAVFFTVDAGPQLKAVCLPGVGREVARRLAEVPGVLDVRLSGLGPGARLVEGEEVP